MLEWFKKTFTYGDLKRQLYSSSGGSNAQDEAAQALAEAGDGPAVEILIEASAVDPNEYHKRHSIKSTNVYRARSAAIKALGVCKTPAAREALAALLCKSDQCLCEEAAQALTRLGDPAAVPALASALIRDDCHAKPDVADAIARLPAKDKVDRLSRVLAHSNVTARYCAAKALALVKGPKSIAALRGALKDPDRGVREAAAESLTKLGWNSDSPEDRIRQLLATHDFAGVRKAGAAATPILAKLLHDKNNADWKDVTNADQYIFEQIVKTLGDGGDPAAVPVLFETLVTIQHLRLKPYLSSIVVAVGKACCPALGAALGKSAAKVPTPLLCRIAGLEPLEDKELLAPVIGAAQGALVVSGRADSLIQVVSAARIADSLGLDAPLKAALPAVGKLGDARVLPALRRLAEEAERADLTSYGAMLTRACIGIMERSVAKVATPGLTAVNALSKRAFFHSSNSSGDRKRLEDLTAQELKRRNASRD